MKANCRLHSWAQLNAAVASALQRRAQSRLIRTTSDWRHQTLALGREETSHRRSMVNSHARGGELPPTEGEQIAHFQEAARHRRDDGAARGGDRPVRIERSANVGTSTFEGNDGNTSSTPPATRTGRCRGKRSAEPDDPARTSCRGQNDNSFSSGSKEDDVNVTIGLGSIPQTRPTSASSVCRRRRCPTAT